MVRRKEDYDLFKKILVAIMVVFCLFGILTGCRNNKDDTNETSITDTANDQNAGNTDIEELTGVEKHNSVNYLETDMSQEELAEVYKIPAELLNDPEALAEHITMIMNDWDTAGMSTDTARETTLNGYFNYESEETDAKAIGREYCDSIADANRDKIVPAIIPEDYLHNPDTVQMINERHQVNSSNIGGLIQTNPKWDMNGEHNEEALISYEEVDQNSEVKLEEKEDNYIISYSIYHHTNSDLNEADLAKEKLFQVETTLIKKGDNLYIINYDLGILLESN